MAGDRYTQRSPMLPLGLQFQLRETLFPTKIVPSITRITVASGSVSIVSGSNREGRIGMLVMNVTAFNASQACNIGFSSGDVNTDGSGWPLRGRHSTTPTEGLNAIWLPLPGGVASGVQAYAGAEGANQTLAILEW